MVPSLLLLLLPKLLAEQVCLTITDGRVHISLPNATVTDGKYGNVPISMLNTAITDGISGEVKCMNSDGFPCLFKCTFSNTGPFNGSTSCMEATITYNGSTVYSFNQYACTLHVCTENSISPLVDSLNGISSGQKDMKQLLYIRDFCVQLFSTSHKVKRLFIQVEKRIIHNIMGKSNLEPGQNITHNLNALSLNVVDMSELDFTSTLPLQAPQLLPQNESFVPNIWLPADALQTIPKEERIIGLVSYLRHNQFKFSEEYKICSMVIRIELLGGRRLHNLATPIRMNFSFPPVYIDNGSELRCLYFDEHGHDSMDWKTDGCETYNITSGTQVDVVCECNHTTPFAVLLIRENIAPIHWEILSYISYIGCGLSAFFTALSLVIYVFRRDHKLDYSISIHVSLSGALFLLNSTFLLTEWGATVKLDWVCVFVAALMHYSLLCCFTWMAIEALHLYLLLIKVFNTYYKHYLVKLSLAGWGIPGIIVAVSLGVKDYKQFYGVTQLTMADTNQTNSICWITDDSFFYSLNLVYFTLIFIFNSGILVAVASSICKMRHVFRSTSRHRAGTEGKTFRDPERFKESCKSGVTVLGLTCLMGTTWGLAFLGSGYVNYPIMYLFCILNSIQGFFIFLWICLSAKKQRIRDMEGRIISNPMKTTGTKSD